MKISTKERIDAYEYALQLDSSVRRSFVGICNWLRLWLYKNNKTSSIACDNVPYYFPEFETFHPEYNDFVMWFDNNFQRDICLELCILMAEDELKNENHIS